MIHNAQQAQSKEHITYIQLCHEDNPMCPSSSPQWLCGNMPAMDGQWGSSHIVSVRTNTVVNKH